MTNSHLYGEWAKTQALRQHLSKPRPYDAACACMGPQGKMPLCPCKMDWCEMVDGKWYVISEIRTDDGIRMNVELLFR